MAHNVNVQQLDELFKSLRPDLQDDFRLRIHRSLSWLKKAEALGNDDLDMQFIALWIALNAAYAKELESENKERGILIGFLDRICSLDVDHHIYNMIWQKFSGPIRLLLQNQFVSHAFWDYHNGKISKADYQQRAIAEHERGRNALESKNTVKLLSVIFDRLYVLRNQIVHGGATYNSSANREQVKDGCAILSLLLPKILAIMLQHHQRDWGKPYYPLVK